MAQSKREIEIFQTLRHRYYTYGICEEKCLCREGYAHHAHYPPHRHVLHQYVSTSISSDYATYVKQHASKRASIGRNESGDFQYLPHKEGSQNGPLRCRRIHGIQGIGRIIRAYPLFPSLPRPPQAASGIISHVRAVDIQLTYNFQNLPHKEGSQNGPLRCRRIHGIQVYNHHGSAYCFLHSPDPPRPHRVSFPMSEQ